MEINGRSQALQKNMSTWFSYFLVFIKFRIYSNNFSFTLNNKAHRSYMCLFTIASQMAEPIWFLIETMVKYILRQKVRILMPLFGALLPLPPTFCQHSNVVTLSSSKNQLRNIRILSVHCYEDDISRTLEHVQSI